MPATSATELFRPGLLEERRIVVAGVRGEPIATAVQGACLSLGARVWAWALAEQGAPEPDEAELEASIERARGELGGVDVLAVDAAALFATHAAGTGRGALIGCLERTWGVTRAAAASVLIADGGGGRIVYLGPRSEAGTHAGAARAGLENLARTLSIEWARHGITVVAIAPGAATTAEEVAALCAYLASPAGEYFSGCLMDLRSPAGA